MDRDFSPANHIREDLRTGKATQDLRKEYDAIRYVLQILDKMLESGNRDNEILLR